jgi:hypothetical protein
MESGGINRSPTSRAPSRSRQQAPAAVLKFFILEFYDLAEQAARSDTGKWGRVFSATKGL